MWFIQRATACCSSTSFCCSLDKPSRSTRSLVTRRRQSSAWPRFSNLHVGKRRLQTLSAVSVEPEISPAKEDHVSSFDWFKNWWMVQAVDNLKTDRPNKIKLLNRDFIVWKGHSGEWIAMDDECPHRLAPLSEGRIEEDGNLLCSYHAWRFNESGKCVKIPHAEDEKAHTVACSSPRSAVQTYPCKARGALLWIWPDKSASAFSDSENSSIPIDDYLADYVERVHEERMFLPFIRYFPCSFDILMDNIFDVSHAPCTHHGVIPTWNRHNAGPIQTKLSEQVTNGRETFSLKFTDPLVDTDGTVTLNTPGAVTYVTQKVEGGPVERAYLTCSPISNTQTLVTLMLFKDDQIFSTKKSNFIEKALSPFMNVMYHLFGLQISDGDIAIVRSQDLKIKAKGFESSKDFYLPTNSDTPVVAFRKWFETAGQRGAAYGGDQPLDHTMLLSREQALNRFENHTKHCKLCSSALKTTETALSVFKFVRLAAVFVGGACLLKIAQTGSLSLDLVLKNSPVVMSVLVLCFSSAVVYMLNKLRAQFYYVGYDFSEKN